MDFSLAAKADVAATDEVQPVPCELFQQSNVNRKHLSRVLALRTYLGACAQNASFPGLQ